MIDSVKEACGIDFNNIQTDEEAIKIAKENQLKFQLEKKLEEIL